MEDNDDNSVLVNNSVIRVSHLEFDSISSLGLNGAEELPIDIVISSQSEDLVITIPETPETPQLSTQLSNMTQSSSNFLSRVGGGGRVRDEVWSVFTDDDNPNSSVSSKCKWCKLNINHYKKSVEVKRHLKKCSHYNSHLIKLTNQCKPDFLKVKEINYGRQSSINKFTIPALTEEEQTLFNYNISMHYYMTATPFQRIECPYLDKALKILRPTLK